MPGTLIFDGDCGFCTKSAEFAERHVARRSDGFAVLPWQFTDLGAYGVTEEQTAAAVAWVGADGTAFFGAAAIAQALRAGRGPWPIAGRLLDAPGIRSLGARVYPWVAEHRHQLPGGTPACKMPQA